MTAAPTLFEVSWEVCNMVGGIHTVLTTKLADLRARYADEDYVAVGPDIPHMVHAPSAFEEELWDPRLLLTLADTGVHVRMGRWKVPERPRVLLVNYSDLYAQKDQILAHYWERYKLDSLFGEWDYYDPVLFGHAAGLVIERYFLQLLLPSRKDAVVQCHEWMAGAAILHLAEAAPELGTVFTTHATTLGRALSAKHQLPAVPEGSDPFSLAREQHCIAKHSMETVVAQVSDVFTTVSESAADECARLLGRPADLVLPNGLGDTFPGETLLAPAARIRARDALFELAERVTLDRYDRERTLLVVASGRYEYVNKGVDVALRSLGAARELLRDAKGRPRVLAFLMFPGGHSGPNRDILARTGRTPESSTHDLRDPLHDPIQRELGELGLRNASGDGVHVVQVPIYLTGQDPLLSLTYYELLAGFDLGLFPSFYDPWGYTPQEALAFGVPSATSDLAGFGRWALTRGPFAESGVHVLARRGRDDTSAVSELAQVVFAHALRTADERQGLAQRARTTAGHASWRELIAGHFQAHARAQGAALARGRDMPRDRYSELAQRRVLVTTTPGGDVTAHMRPFVVTSELPAELSPLRVIARNLWWSWDGEARTLFQHLEPKLWGELKQQGPLAFLERVPGARLRECANDAEFVAKVARTLTRLEQHVAEAKPVEIAYFCMEFGLESHVHLYSGGLGVLAGDHLKTASDMNLPLCALGLAYQSGYFRQAIDSQGRQESPADPNDFAALGAELVRTPSGDPLIVEIPFPGREVRIRTWLLRVGRICLYLLDTRLDTNRPDDRTITDRLYGGDATTRLSQELVLGVGGHRVLEAMGKLPAVFHMNEGHSAFLVLARLSHLIQDGGLKFAEALDYIRHTTIFTSHTPVPAGHDRFEEALARPYLSPFEAALHLDWNELLALGKPVERQVPADRFGTTELAIRGSLRVNGVSKIHGQVMREMFRDAYPGYHHEEIPIGSITNGVHVATWVAPAIQALYARHVGPDYLENLANGEAFARFRDAPAEELWETHRALRTELVTFLRRHLRAAWQRRRISPAKLLRALEVFDDDPLLIGFARRFAPYKRADMVFADVERLARILHGERPVVLLFGGKAHPRDTQGQELIKRIVDLSLSPELLGRVFVVENYDMDIARLLVAGCDVWLNTPTRPLEASGTSGMKAAMNGCLNLSVPDGWWAECANGANGWVIGDDDPHVEAEVQTSYDSHALYALLEDEVVPTYHRRDARGVPADWVRMMKESIATSVPAFSFDRMLGEYAAQYYGPARHDAHTLRDDNFRALHALRALKRHLVASWPGVEFTDVRIDGLSSERVLVGTSVDVRAELRHPGLDPGLLDVQIVLAHGPVTGKLERFEAVAMQPDSPGEGGERSRWRGRFLCGEAGPHALALRVVPRGVHAEGDVEVELDLVRWL